METEAQGSAPPSQQERIIGLPEDLESKISVFLWASDLVMQERITDLTYKDERNQKVISGLSKGPRDIEKENKRHLAMHIRLYGPISQQGKALERESAQRWYILGLAIVVGSLLVAGFVSYTPGALAAVSAFWATSGGFVEAGLLVVALVVLLVLYRRRSRRRQGA